MNINEKKNNYISFSFFKKQQTELIKKYRLKFFNHFRKNIKFTKKSRVLDVGFSESREKYNNLFLNKYPFKNKITSISNQKPFFIKKIFPQICFKICNAKKMKFKNNSFDIVHSNAVIEHVGSFNNQLKFVSECFRVSKKYVFIQTPYKFFPLEIHTKIPLIHYLPHKFYAPIYEFFGFKSLSKIENLNLMSISDIKKILKILNIIKYSIIKIKLFGFTSNIILVIKK